MNEIIVNYKFWIEKNNKKHIDKWARMISGVIFHNQMIMIIN